MVDDPDAFESARQFLGDLAGPIRARVIDDDDFVTFTDLAADLQGLASDALDRRFVALHREEDADAVPSGCHIDSSSDPQKRNRRYTCHGSMRSPLTMNAQ